MKTAVLVFCLLLTGNLFAQKEGYIHYTLNPILIDGFIEDVWDAAAIQNIDVPFKTEMATIGNSTWQALYDNDNFYCVVYVEDDNHWPAWESGGNNWEYDKPEFYWDVNEVRKDGVGAGVSNSGHYQFAPGFADGSYDMAITQSQSAPGNLNPGGTFAYSLLGEGYVFEIAVPWKNLTDKNGNIVEEKVFRDRGIGFDVTIIDQDEGVTTARQRMNWNNSGAIDECWNNMDDAGVIYEMGLVCGDCDGVEAVKNELVQTVAFPTFANNQISFSRGIDSVELFNSLGRLVLTKYVQGKTTGITELPNGFYMIKTYKRGQFKGVTKIIKN